VAGAAAHWLAAAGVGLHLLLTCSSYDGWPHDGLCATVDPLTGLHARASVAGLLRAKRPTSDVLLYHRCATDGGNPLVGRWLLPRWLWPLRLDAAEQPQAHPATAAAVLVYSSAAAVLLLALALVLWLPRAPDPKPPPPPLLFLRNQRERRSRGDAGARGGSGGAPTALLGADAEDDEDDEADKDDEEKGNRRRRPRARHGHQRSLRPSGDEGFFALEEEAAAAMGQGPTFRSLGARANAYIPLTDRGYGGLLRPRELAPLQPPTAPTLRLHTVTGSNASVYRSE